MRLGYLLAVALCLAGCGHRSSATVAGIPSFNFPDSISKSTEAAQMANKGLQQSESEAAKTDKSLESAMHSVRQVETDTLDTIGKDPNKAAADALAGLKKNPLELNALMSSSTLAQMFAVRVRSLPVDDARQANEELKKYCEAAESIVKGRLTDQGQSITQSFQQTAVSAAIALGDDEYAKRVSKELLAENSNKLDWNYGNVVHNSNMVLADIAFRAKDLDEASKKLIAAGESTGSPQLDSFGPNFPVAKDLWEAGRKEAVLRYLNGISKFWNEDVVKGWIKTLKSGSEPTDRQWRWATRD